MLRLLCRRSACCSRSAQLSSAVQFHIACSIEVVFCSNSCPVLNACCLWQQLIWFPSHVACKFNSVQFQSRCCLFPVPKIHCILHCDESETLSCGTIRYISVYILSKFALLSPDGQLPTSKGFWVISLLSVSVIWLPSSQTSIVVVRQYFQTPSAL